MALDRIDGEPVVLEWKIRAHNAEAPFVKSNT